MSSLTPLVIRSAVDALRASASWASVGRYASLVLLLALGDAGFQFLQRRLLYGVSRDVESELRDALYERLVHQPPAYFDGFPTGDVLSRFSNDVGAVRMALGPGVMFGIETIATLVLAVLFMSTIDPWLTLWALAPLPFVSIAVKALGHRIHHRSERAQEALADVSTAVQENLAGLRVVRAYGREETQRSRFGGTSGAYVDANLKLARIQATLGPVLGFLLGTGLLILLYLGGRRVAAGTITLGDFVAFTMYLGMIGWPMIAFGWIANLWQRASSAMGRLNRVLLAEPTIDDRLAVPGARIREGGVAFRDVTFRYAAARAPVLEGLDLEVPAGMTLGITGPTGGGKTTLVQLVPRLYDPTAGRVEVDGRAVADYRLAELRGAIAMAPQEPFLFSETLRANLLFGVDGDGRAPRLSIEEAVAIAGLEDDLEQWPEGLDTRVGERGITLSGGQKQRAALARALLVDPRILILDDAFSSVDTETEERILARLRHYMAERTTFLVSHRISTLRHADRIVVLDQGRIVEKGSHAELIAAGGRYAALERRQRLELEVESA